MKLETLALFLILIASGKADVAVRTTYGTDGSCEPGDWEKIYPAERRNLRSRDQCIFNYYNCYQACTSWPLWQCWLAFPCYCVRRLDGNRQLDFVSDCQAEKAKVHGRHTSVFDSLSPSCQTHVQTRQLECFEMKLTANEDDYKVNSLQLINSDTDQVVISSLVDGDSFCENDFTFSIEAVAGSGVENVKFELYGPGGYNYIHTEYHRRFTMFTNHLSQINGEDYGPGEYNLMVTPNGDPTKAEMLRFFIKQSTDAECAASSTASCSSQDHLNECTTTKGCQGIYSGATDCNNNAGGVCYCGSEICGCFGNSNSSPPPPPPPPASPDTCGKEDFLSECTSTTGCKGMYNGATDCKNSEGGVCFCGSDVCGCLDNFSPPPPPAQDTCNKQDFQNECSSTRGCKRMYNGATDCKNREGGVCFCGRDVCGCL